MRRLRKLIRTLFGSILEKTKLMCSMTCFETQNLSASLSLVAPNMESTNLKKCSPLVDCVSAPFTGTRVKERDSEPWIHSSVDMPKHYLPPTSQRVVLISTTSHTSSTLMNQIPTRTMCTVSAARVVLDE